MNFYSLSTDAMSTIRLCGITALLDVFFWRQQHKDLTELRHHFVRALQKHQLLQSYMTFSEVFSGAQSLEKCHTYIQDITYVKLFSAMAEVLEPFFLGAERNVV